MYNLNKNILAILTLLSITIAQTSPGEDGASSSLDEMPSLELAPKALYVKAIVRTYRFDEQDDLPVNLKGLGRQQLIDLLSELNSDGNDANGDLIAILTAKLNELSVDECRPAEGKKRRTK